MRFADILIELGSVDAERVAEMLSEQPESVGSKDFSERLREAGIASESDILAAFARLYGLDFAHRVDDDMIDPALIEDLPIAWARSHCVLPARHAAGTVMLTSQPDAHEEEKYLSLLLQEDLVPLLAPADEIRRVIEQCYVSREGGSAAIMAGLEAEPKTLDVRDDQSETDLLSRVENAPVTSLVNMILLEAVKAGASDIHVEPYRERIQVRYRIDGVLYQQSAPPKRLQDPLISRLKVMARLDIAEKRLPQDGMAKVRAGERDIDIRVSTVPIADGERMVLRILSRQSVLKPMEGLGMSSELLRIGRELMAEPQGIVLVTGPTGSGKTTTLYAGLQQLDTDRLNVITIEDPIEYQIEGISQIQVKPRIGLGFASGLRHILRQDPDVVLVGEIRDAETAEIAIRASLTGHLVLSTIHTNDAVSTPLRIIDMGIKPYLLSESLRAVIAQRLVRRLCASCRTESAWTSDEIARLPARLTPPADGSHHHTAVGCEKCRDGYRGRLGIFEYLLVNPSVKAAIRDQAQLSQLRQIADRHKMETLWKDALRKILDGSTSLEEAERVLGRAEG